MSLHPVLSVVVSCNLHPQAELYIYQVKSRIEFRVHEQHQFKHPSKACQLARPVPALCWTACFCICDLTLYKGNSAPHLAHPGMQQKVR